MNVTRIGEPVDGRDAVATTGCFFVVFLYLSFHVRVCLILYCGYCVVLIWGGRRLVSVRGVTFLASCDRRDVTSSRLMVASTNMASIGACSRVVGRPLNGTRCLVLCLRSKVNRRAFSNGSIAILTRATILCGPSRPVVCDRRGSSGIIIT